MFPSLMSLLKCPSRYVSTGRFLMFSSFKCSLCRYSKLIFVVNCNVVFSSQLLTNHYERCWKYYCLPNGWANFGVTSEEELHLSRKLFWGIFESLAHKVRWEKQLLIFYHSHYFGKSLRKVFSSPP